MYEIEKGIEPPKGQMGRRRSYPFPDMEIGDSFFVPFEEGDLKVKAAVQAALSFDGGSITITHSPEDWGWGIGTSITGYAPVIITIDKEQ